MGKAGTAIRAAAFLLLFCLVFLVVQELVTPDHNWPADSTRQSNNIRGFYAEPKDDIQVLWIGGSHMRCGLTPMVIYRETGVRSYNLSTDDQTISLSLVWLKLALERQKPEVVVLDASSLLHSANSDKKEMHWRLLVDSIRWNRLRDKYRVMEAYCELNGLGFMDRLDGLIPLLRFHTHYLLEASEFAVDFSERISFTKGYSFLSTVVPSERLESDLEPLDGPRGDSPPNAKLTERLEGNRPIFEEMLALCRSHGCELVLTKIPVNTAPQEYSSYWSREKHDLIADLASDTGCRFVDLNYEDLGLDWSRDTKDAGRHLNSSGARKVSRFFGSWLEANYSLDTSADASLAGKWERQLALYEMEEKLYDLRLETDAERFLERLSGSGLTALVAASGSPDGFLNADMLESIARTVGAGEATDAWIGGKRAYLAVGTGGEPIAAEAHSHSCSAEGALADGTAYSIRCDGSGSRISVGPLTYECGAGGLLIVVYDDETHCVIEGVELTGKDGQVNLTTQFRTGRTRFNHALKRYEDEYLRKI